MSGDFAKKTEILERQLNGVRGGAAKKEKCIPTMLIAGVAAPFVVGLVLYFVQPSFVQKKEGGKYIRDKKKILMWTTIVTFVLWIAMYLFTYCSGYNSKSMMCASR